MKVKNRMMENPKHQTYIILLQPNEAGLAYLKLYHTTWRTNETHSLQGQQPLHVRAFKGDYRINVKQGGQVVKSETFKLNFSGKLIEVHLNGSGKQIFLCFGPVSCLSIPS